MVNERCLTHLYEILENTNFLQWQKADQQLPGGEKKGRLIEQDIREHGGGYGNMLYVDWGGVYMAVYIFQNPPNFTLKMEAFCCI